MDMWQVINTLIPIGSIALAFVAMLRNKRTDDTSAAQQLAQVMTQIGVLQGQISELNAKLDRKDEQHLMLIERVTKVEASSSQAHKRIDDLAGGPSRKE